MIRFKALLFLLSISFLGFNLQSSNPSVIKWVISQNSSLQVNGSTTVNKFSCVIANYSNPDTLTFYKNSPSETVKLSGSIKLDVQNFDCHNLMMTKDLRKTLKAKEFPQLLIRFISLNRYPDLKETGSIKGLVTIGLAGTTKQFEIDYRLVPDGTAITFIGTRKVTFSDFNLIPPRKLGGMIKTNDELNVEFILKLKVLD